MHPPEPNLNLTKSYTPESAGLQLSSSFASSFMRNLESNNSTIISKALCQCCQTRNFTLEIPVIFLKLQSLIEITTGLLVSLTSTHL